MRPVHHASVRRALVRVVLALLALVTVAAPAAAAVGEGVLASRAGRSPVAVHVEDARRAQCPYVHADDCVLCAVVGAHALPGAVTTAAPATVTERREVRVPESCAHSAQGGADVRFARGPPTG